eukprot:363711-Chlamydomonas_euryale.AAC.8
MAELIPCTYMPSPLKNIPGKIVLLSECRNHTCYDTGPKGSRPKRILGISVGAEALCTVQAVSHRPRHTQVGLLPETLTLTPCWNSAAPYKVLEDQGRGRTSFPSPL